MITGSQGMSVSDVTADGSPTGDIKTATTFTFDAVTVSGVNRTVDYSTYGYAGAHVLSGGPFTLSVPVPPVTGNMFSIGDAGFGTFTATKYLVNDTSPVNGRNIVLLGTFTPGTELVTNSGGTLTANDAQLTLAFTQTGGPGNAISVSLTLVSPPDVASVPEPATMTIAGLGIGICAVGSYIRRRRTIASA
jgi:hypothetical protein